ncbi:MAG TPA: class I poly(R)-hydroxyalkanoic acid synthase [Burkholderiales bacterium]
MTSPAKTPGDVLRELNRASAGMVEQVFRDAPAGAGADVAALMQVFTAADAQQIGKLRALEEAFYQEHFALWSQMAAPSQAAAPESPGGDHRFEAAEWKLPFFRYVRQAYLVNARFLRGLGELAQLEPAARRRLQYQLRQMTDAMAPNNFPATNPEVVRLAAESGGASLAQGMKLLAADLARGRISMSDEQAFAVGRNLAVTPGSVVFENEVMQLIQYAPATASVHEVPLLIVPPFINKYYILDLRPENSFVRFCVEQGFSTFIVSWRNVPAQLGHLKWDDYIEQGVLAPLAAVRAISAAGKVNTLGFCVGGTLLACALAVLAARNESGRIESVTLLATMLDFAETGDISVYIDRDFVERTEQEFRQTGLMPGSKLANTFAMLRANDLIWHFIVSNYFKGQPPRAFDLLYWNADGSNIPGRLYAWYLRNMYFENNLKIPRRLEALGAPLDLGAICAPAYILATREDHIVPWKSAYASTALLKGPCEFVLGASGHVAGIVNPPAQKRRNFWINASKAADADAWLADATQQAGSWWSHWASWLRARSGPLEPAAQPGSAQYPAIEAAPGRYVKEKSV